MVSGLAAMCEWLFLKFLAVDFFAVGRYCVACSFFVGCLCCAVQAIHVRGSVCVTVVVFRGRLLRCVRRLSGFAFRIREAEMLSVCVDLACLGFN